MVVEQFYRTGLVRELRRVAAPFAQTDEALPGDGDGFGDGIVTSLQAAVNTKDNPGVLLDCRQDAGEEDLLKSGEVKTLGRHWGIKHWDDLRRPPHAGAVA